MNAKMLKMKRERKEKKKTCGKSILEQFDLLSFNRLLEQMCIKTIHQ